MTAMKRLLFCLFIPFASQSQDVISATGSLNAIGIEAARDFEPTGHFMPELHAGLHRPLTHTKSYWVGEQYVYEKSPVVPILGFNMLYVPHDREKYDLWFYGAVGIGASPLLQAGYWQAGAGARSMLFGQGLDAMLSYRLGFDRYENLGGWTLRIGLTFGKEK